DLFQVADGRQRLGRLAGGVEPQLPPLVRRLVPGFRRAHFPFPFELPFCAASAPRRTAAASRFARISASLVLSCSAMREASDSVASNSARSEAICASSAA